MATAVGTIKRTGTEAGGSRAIRKFGSALAGSFNWLEAAARAHYDAMKMDIELEGLTPGERIDAALRWHARQGRIL